MLYNQTKCKQEANNFLKSSIESMEKELSSVQMKAENYRRSYSVDSIDYQKKILELENIVSNKFSFFFFFFPSYNTYVL